MVVRLPKTPILTTDTKLVSSSNGFTLIEILVGVAIIAIISFLAMAALMTLHRQVDLDSTTQGILSTLRLARTRTIASEAETTYGVHFETNKYVLFSGDTYVSGAVGNKEYLLTDSEIYQINLNGGGRDVVFDRIRGTTSTTGDIRVRLIRDTSRISVININASGQVSLSDTLSETGTRITDSRHLHFDLGWSIQSSTTLTLNFTDSPIVTQNIPMAGFFNADKSVFDWSGTINVNGSDQVLRIHTHFLDGINTILSIHRDRRFNNKPLKVSISGNEIVSYTDTGIPTVGPYGGTMTEQ